MNKSSKRRDARAQRLESAIARVAQSFRCTAAAMRSALAADEWEDYKAAAARCFGPELSPSEKAEFARYKRCLRRGDALYARIVKLSVVGLQAMRRERLTRAADREYAAAWETLDQLMIQNPFVQVMLDRPFNESSATADDIARPLSICSELAKQDALGCVRELLRCQHSALLNSLSRLREQDAHPGPAGSSADCGEALGWDALFGFIDRTNIAGTSSIDDTWAPNTEALLLPSGAHRELL